MQWSREKKEGVHYTPEPLADFLADQMVPHLPPKKRISILDPACGDGKLLCAFAASLDRSNSKARACFHAFDKDEKAVLRAKKRLGELDSGSVAAKQLDFIEYAIRNRRPVFDCIISNPPYVRTQVLGGRESQRLARQFGLSGRVDLYQVFTAGMSRLLKTGGVLGLLTSNRFLSIKSGRMMRELLSREFELKDVFDLGDTRMFENASVLPVVVIGVKRDSTVDGRMRGPAPRGCNTGFHRVYRKGDSSSSPYVSSKRRRSLLDAVAGKRRTSVRYRDEAYRIERGSLMISEAGIWSLTSAARERWLSRLRRKQHCTFGDVCSIKVGIKTTADNVFVRENWQQLPINDQPEPALIRPLITHHIAERWSTVQPCARQVLYPYAVDKEPRTTVKAKQYPAAFRYLRKHRQQLLSRQYLVDAGRKWFEIWVPHQPVDWAAAKIVWPDISVEPKFFLDLSGAIVGGDSYWIKLHPDVDKDWLFLLLGVANSTIATRFYDSEFHNKLYAGRRRFMTQYVKQFPLPDLKTPESRQIVRTVRKLVRKKTSALEKRLEQEVQSAFGLARGAR